MNFLKVKKLVFTFCLSFFISVGFVNAATLKGQVYFEKSGRADEYRHSINLFEETKDYTGFIELLYNQGFTLGQYLDNYFSINDSEFFNDKYDYTISIFTQNDLNYLTKVHYHSSNGSDTLYDSYELYRDTILSQRMLFLDNYNIDDAYYFIFFGKTKTDNTASTLTKPTYYSEASINDDNFSLSIYDPYIFAFDSNGNPIGYFNYSSLGGYSRRLDFEFPFDDEENPDMTSWYAYTYNVSKLSSDFYEKIYPYYFYFNNSSYTTSSNSGYSAIENFWHNLMNGFSDFQFDFTRWNMQFVYNDVFYKDNISFIPLMKRWNDSTSYVVPSNYEMINISNTEKGYYLDFRDNNCSTNDYILYYSSDSYIDKHKMYLTYYKGNVGENSLEFYKSFYTFSNKSFKIYSYNPLLDLGVSVSELQDYVVNITQSSLVIDYKVYYNPTCYLVSSGSNTSATFTFPSGDITLDSNDLNNNYISNNTTQYNPNGNVTSNNSTGSSNSNVTNDSADSVVNVSNIIQNIPSYITAFTSSISALVGIVTVFLTGLPVEILSILLSFFIIGLVTLIIKLV